MIPLMLVRRRYNKGMGPRLKSTMGRAVSAWEKIPHLILWNRSQTHEHARLNNYNMPGFFIMPKHAVFNMDRFSFLNTESGRGHGDIELDIVN